MAEINESKALTWRELIDLAIEWCLDEGVCLAYLAEQALIQEGYQGRAYMLPDEAKTYIAERMLSGDKDMTALVQAHINLSETTDDTPGKALVIAERKRQIEVEGFGAKRDSQYTGGELLKAAECYADPVFEAPNTAVPKGWPWPEAWWKPGAPTLNLAKAGALILAEQDRLNEAAGVWTIGASDLNTKLAEIVKRIDELASKEGAFNTI
jgi:hypothetical protein